MLSHHTVVRCSDMSVSKNGALGDDSGFDAISSACEQLVLSAEDQWACRQLKGRCKQFVLLCVIVQFTELAVMVARFNGYDRVKYSLSNQIMLGLISWTACQFHKIRTVGGCYGERRDIQESVTERGTS